MHFILIFLQIVVALGLLNVWVIRRNQKTAYRGCGSTSLKNEFISYGLPLWSLYVVGFIKIGSALLLLLGLWKPFVVVPTALVVSVMMTGAVAMHIKVKDPFQKVMPALVMLILSVAICLVSLSQS